MSVGVPAPGTRSCGCNVCNLCGWPVSGERSASIRLAARPFRTFTTRTWEERHLHWLLIVACGGVNTALDQPDIAVWSHMTAISGLVMVLQAPGTAFFLRGSGVPFWRRRVVLVPATLGLLVIGFVIGIVNLPGPTPTDYLSLLSFAAICAVLAALVMLLWGALRVLEDAPRRRALRHPARVLGRL